MNVALAVTGYWTGGGEDGKWSNPANWQGGVIPGIYSNATDRVGNAGDTAVFGEVAANAQTVIDLADQYTILNVKIEGNAPSYCFGSSRSEGQKLSLEASGVISIAAEVATTQTILQVGLPSAANSTLRNNSAAMVTYYDVYRAAGYTSGTPWTFYLDGSGPITIGGAVKYDNAATLGVNGSGLRIWNYPGPYCSAYRYSTTNFGSAMTELLVNKTFFGLGGSATWATQINVGVNCGAHFYGPGVLSMHYPYNAPVDTPQAIVVGSGGKAIFDVGVSSVDGMYARDLLLRGLGDVYLNSTNRLSGYLRLMQGVTCYAKMIGNKGCVAEETSIPLGDKVIFEGYWTATYSGNPNKVWSALNEQLTEPRTASLKYSGDVAAETDRDFVVSNICSTTSVRVSTNTFANAGGGKFTLNSALIMAEPQDELNPGNVVRHYAQEAAFRLSAETEDLDFKGSFPQADKTWHLFFGGQKTVTVFGTHENVKGNLRFEGGTAAIVDPLVFPNAAEWQLAGGRLQFTGTGDDTGSMEIKAAVDTGNSVLAVPAGVTLTVTGFDGDMPNGATLNFEIPDGATVKMPDAPRSVRLPTAVRVNGFSAKVLDDGTLASCLGVWKEAVDGEWSDSSNWTPAAVPGEGDSAVIAASGDSYTVTVDAGAADGLNAYVISNATEGATATLSGSIFFTNGCDLIIGKGGRLASSSGVTDWFDKTKHIGLEGGEIDFSGTAVLAMTNHNSYSTVSNNIIFGTGTVKLSDTAEIRVTPHVNGKSSVDGTYQPNLILRPNAPGETSRLKLSGTPYITVVGDGRSIFLGYDCPGGKSILDFDITGTTQIKSRCSNSYYGYRAGVGNGYGEINLKSGDLHVSNAGFYLGVEYGITTSTVIDGHFPTGVVNQTGGLFSGGSFQGAYSSEIWGTFIGGAARVKPNSKSRYVGIYNLSGGRVSVNTGLFIVGAGPCSEGYFNVSDTGSFNYAPNYTHSSSTGTDTYTHPLLIGFGGGYGEFNMSGVAVTNSQNLYVGGALLTDIGLTGKDHHVDAAYVNKDLKSTGVLSLSGGSFECKKEIWVGANGTGTVAIVGGELTCTKLVLSDKDSSTLKLTVGEDYAALGALTATESIDISDAAKLVVDLGQVSAYRRRLVKLAGAGAVNGSFGDDMIEIKASPALAEKFSGSQVLYENAVGEKGIYLETPKIGGLILIR